MSRDKNVDKRQWNNFRGSARPRRAPLVSGGRISAQSSGLTQVLLYLATLLESRTFKANVPSAN